MKRKNVDMERMDKAAQELKDLREKINKEIEKKFDEYTERASRVHPQGVRLIDYLREYTMRGGKRVRPALVIAGYRAVGGKDVEKIVPASLPIEALHSYFLIHDDIMDEDEMRRGLPSLHKLYEKYHRENFSNDNSERFGENMGIVAGDISNSFAVSQLIESDFEPEVKIEALKKFEEIHRYTGYGQTLDVIFNEKDADEVSEDDVLTIHLLKTAQYTIAGPLELGAIFGRGTDEQKEMLRDCGIKAGKSFQIYDDILGLYGKEERTGKPADSDIKEGKKTLLVLKALENGNEEQRETILNALGNEDVEEEEVEKVREIVKETGSYDYSWNLAMKLAKRGKEVLDDDVLDPEIVGFLKGLADYIITREI